MSVCASNVCRACMSVCLSLCRLSFGGDLSIDGWATSGGVYQVYHVHLARFFYSKSGTVWTRVGHNRTQKLAFIENRNHVEVEDRGEVNVTTRFLNPFFYGNQLTSS